MNRGTKRAIAIAWIAAATGMLGTTGCSSRGERPGWMGGKMMDDTTALAALKDAEASGKLDGLEIEHYVGGGLPPPHYRSEQFRLYVFEGRDTLAFVTPDFTANVKQGESYPRHVYRLPATPSDVRTIARLARESGAFSGTASPPGTQPHDGVRTELVVIRGGKEAKHVYAGGEPAELAKLRDVVNPLIARLKAQGEHRVER